MTRYDIEHLRGLARRAVQKHGLRPTADRAGIPVGRLRGLIDGRSVQSTTIEMVAAAFSTGPTPRPAAVTVPEWAAPIAHDIEEVRRGLDRLEHAVSTFGDPAARPVDIAEVRAAAGAGAVDIDNAPLQGRAWFPRAFLDSHAIEPDRAVIIRVHGESMEPTLPNGCSILLDRSRRQRRGGRIYVMQTSDGLIVKRAIREGESWQLVSDHPEWPPAPWPDDARIVGEVRWMALSF